MEVSTFNNFVKQEQPVTPGLPLLHTCEAYDFRNIFRSKKLKTFPCEDFGDEPLLFFFYGKPSFRTSKGETSTSNFAFMPVALAVQPGSLTSIKRIAPFDTGAFFRNLFSSHMHPRMQCTDFLLNPSLDMPGRLVARFFGSNENYYFGRPQHLLIPPLAFEAQAYYNLIQ